LTGLFVDEMSNPTCGQLVTNSHVSPYNWSQWPGQFCTPLLGGWKWHCSSIESEHTQSFCVFSRNKRRGTSYPDSRVRRASWSSCVYISE
jgi:hypothetical protein